MRPGREKSSLGPGVVDAALLRRRDHALERADLGRDVELRSGEFGDRAVTGLLHPPLQCVGAVQLATRVGVEHGDRFGDGCPGLDLVRDGLLLGDHARELFDAPLVGLVEVDDGTEEVPRLQGVDVAPDRVLLAGLGLEFCLEEVREPAVGRRGLERPRAEVPLERLGELGVAGLRRPREVAEEPVGSRVLANLRGDLAHLAHRRDDSAAHALAQRLDVPVDRAGHRGQARGDAFPLDGVVGRHEVEHLTDVLRGARDDVEVAEVEAGLVLLEFELELAAEVGDRDAVDVVDGGRGAKRRERRACRRDRTLMPVGRIVGETLVFGGTADVRADARIEFDERVDPPLCDAIDVGRGALTRCHAPSLGQGSDAAQQRRRARSDVTAAPTTGRRDSVRGVLPVRTTPDLHVERHEEVGRVRHAVAHDGLERLGLTGCDLEDQLVVHGEQHSAAEPLRGDLGLRRRPWRSS